MAGTHHTDKTFRFELVSPERVLASEEASMVVVPGEAGDFGVLAGHSPLLSSVRPGVVRITLPDGAMRKVFVSGGFADVGAEICAVLAEEAVNVDDLDRAELADTLKTLEDSLAAAANDAMKTAQVPRDIDITRAKIAALQ